jgi:hypothetical protein
MLGWGLSPLGKGTPGRRNSFGLFVVLLSFSAGIGVGFCLFCLSAEQQKRSAFFLRRCFISGH